MRAERAGSAAIREAAPAKLNLYLEVTGRRADGYHMLDSLVAFAEAGDAIELRRAARLTLTIDGPFASALAGEPAETNLVVRAARGLGAAVGRVPDVAIHLRKELPVASGLGGGSADAAATLRALARAWDLAPGDPRIGAVARTLGQDVPACLDGRPAHFRGIGDETEPADGPLPPLDVLLVNPAVPLATPAVFKARAGAFSPPRPFGRLPPDRDALLRRLRERRNDLSEAAQRIVPAVGAALELLAASPGCELARMSGSGATCFGLFADTESCTMAAAAIQAAQPAWWVAPTRLRA